MSAPSVRKCRWDGGEAEREKVGEERFEKYQENSSYSSNKTVNLSKIWYIEMFSGQQREKQSKKDSP